MLIKLAFYKLFENRRVRVVGVYYDGFIYDGSGRIRAVFPERVKGPIRVDAIGVIEEDKFLIERRREIDFETEFRWRRKALEIADEYIEEFRRLVEEAKKKILEVLKVGPMSYNELRSSIDVVDIAFDRALRELMTYGEIIEIEPGVYSL